MLFWRRVTSFSAPFGGGGKNVFTLDSRLGCRHGQ